MVEKVTSIKIDEGLWRRVKLHAVREGIKMKDLIRELISAVVRGDELAREAEVDEELVRELLTAREEGEQPLTLLSDKSAVELVREGRDRLR